VHFGLCALLVSALLPAAIAQDTGTVEGRVLSSTSQTPIGGAEVSLAGRRTLTDASGNFGFAGVTSGDIIVSAEAQGFYKNEAKRRLDFRAPLRLEILLTPTSSISGRVLDDEGKPIADVQIEVTDAVRGTGTTWTVRGTSSDAEGRYRVDPIRPGTYVVMARPNPRIAGGLNGSSRTRSLPPPKPAGSQSRTWVRTYYPSAADRGLAGKLVLAGGTHLSGCDIRLLAPVVYAIRGMVYDDSGALADAKVKLLSNELMELAETEVRAKDGFFEVPGVPAGEWHLIAEAEHDGVKLRGTYSATVARHDLVGITIRLVGPFALPATIEPDPKDARISIELYPADGPAGGAAYSKTAGGLQFPAVYPGRYKVNVFGTIQGHYLDSIYLGDQPALGREITLTSGAVPLRVVFRSNAGAVRGKVDRCASGSVVLLPTDESLWDFRFILQAACDTAGNFEIGGIRPGDYYVAAFDRVTSSGLDDLSTLRRIVALATRTTIDGGRTSLLDLKCLAWPE
jgi:hypothetical protein